ncbi:MAG: response regulator [Methanolinea sp.]|nr:response regulator [Methanolinea sp.]
MTSSTILVVDDNRYIVDGLVAILTRRGYDTLAANSGEEALTLLQKTIPDLILLDITMGPIDGWATLEKVRRRPESARIPVIVFSARKSLADEASRSRLEVAEVIQKPINTGTLLEAIDRALKGRKTGFQKAEEREAEFHINIGFDKHIIEP